MPRSSARRDVEWISIRGLLGTSNARQVRLYTGGGAAWTETGTQVVALRRCTILACHVTGAVLAAEPTEAKNNAPAFVLGLSVSTNPNILFATDPGRFFSMTSLMPQLVNPGQTNYPVVCAGMSEGRAKRRAEEGFAIGFDIWQAGGEALPYNAAQAAQLFNARILIGL